MAQIRARPRHFPEGSKGARAFASLDDLLRLRGRAHGFSFLPRQPVRSLLTGRHASRLRGRGLNFEELRHYFEGDDTRTIDWLATARLGSPHVRVYTEERDRPVLFVVDQRRSMFFGSSRAMKSVVAAEAAAIGAWRVVSLGDRVGAVVFGDEDIVEVRPLARDEGATRLLGEVARQNARLGAERAPEPAAGQLNEALRRAERLAKHDWLVCVISDGFGADAETDRLVTRILAHNDLLVVFVFDPLEAELPDVGRATFVSGDRRIEVDTAAKPLRRAYFDDHAGWRARLSALSLSRQVPVLPISTDRDPARQLRELIGRRASRAARR